MRVGAILVGLVLVGACTGSAETDAVPPSNGESDETRVEPTASPSVTTIDPAVLDDVYERRALKAPIEIDPTAEDECGAYGYPCSWAEAEPGAAERSIELLEEVTDLVGPDEQISPREELLRVERYLLEIPDVVSIEWDTAAATSLEFRVEGAQPVVVLTEAASPRSGFSGPQGFAGVLGQSAVSEAGFDPTPEPGDRQRTAIVFDPYHLKDGAEEAEAVKRIFEAHPEFTVTHLVEGAADANALLDFASADAVHVVSHGSTWCPDGDPTSPRCRSGFGLGPIPADTAASSLPPDVTFTRSRGDELTRAYVRDSFFAGGFEDTVIMLNACQTAGWRVRGATVGMMSQFGAALGWNQNVYASYAQDAAERFWDLMVNEGLDAELAYERLVAEDLDVGDIRPDVLADIEAEFALSLNKIGVDWSTQFDLAPQARLVFGGEPRRVRDVVKSFHDGDEIVGGTSIRTEGRIEDGDPNTIEEIRVEVEGVRAGEEGATRIRILVDDKAVKPDFTLEGASSKAGDGDAWNDWGVVLEDVKLPFDLTRRDIDPEQPRPHTWEVRVSDDGFSTYSATKAEPVFFGGDVEASGPLPTITGLESELPPGGVLEGNELVIRFNTAGGESTGDFLAAVTAQGTSVLTWTMDLQGTFDTENSTISGVVQARGDFPFGTGDQATGEFEATVDFANARVEGVLDFPRYQEPFVATIVY